MGFFLSGMKIEDGVEYKFDKASDFFKKYNYRCYDANRFVFPAPEEAGMNYIVIESSKAQIYHLV